MIQIRNSMFETNSSSCHVFVYKRKKVVVPESVELVPDSNDSILNVIFNDYFRWYRPERSNDEMSTFIDYLYMMGIKTITCSDESISKLIESRKNCTNHSNGYLPGFRTYKQLRDVLFNTDTILTTMEDFEVYPEKIEEMYGSDYKFAAFRLS